MKQHVATYLLENINALRNELAQDRSYVSAGYVREKIDALERAIQNAQRDAKLESMTVLESAPSKPNVAHRPFAVTIEGDDGTVWTEQVIAPANSTIDDLDAIIAEQYEFAKVLRAY